ncbi:MAG: hypothetical protein KC505_04190 [Myxococcales bacterium]|nr:hypothetical protein [Myxococcales bacterium]USN50204.1 MAG: hypothetical protein H6731_08020 [Myxococcales bacterium]
MSWFCPNNYLILLKVSVLAISFCGGACKKNEQELKTPIEIKQKKLLKKNKAQLRGIFVDQASTARQADGKSWKTAFKTVQQAINISQGEPIIIASGVYKSPNLSIKNKQNLHFVGGYKAGEEQEKEPHQFLEKDWVILDGEHQAKPLLTISGNSNDISFSGHIIFRNVTGASAVKISGNFDDRIENIYFYNCRFVDNRCALGQGAGIFINNAKNIYLNDLIAQRNQSQSGGFIYAAAVENLFISGGGWFDNKALSGGSTAQGGALFGQNLKQLSLKNVLIYRGESQLGGAVFLKKVSDSVVSDVRFENNSFSSDCERPSGAGLYVEDSKNIELLKLSLVKNGGKNVPNSSGGALSIVRSSELKVDFFDADILSNEAYFGGAVALINSKNILIKNGNFSDNKAYQVGGAIFSKQGEDIFIESSKLSENKSLSYGGALYFADTKAKLSLNDLQFKKNQSTGLHGGALAIISQKENSLVTLNALEFLENRARVHGGAAFFGNVQGKVVIENTHFKKNYANIFGGALALDAKSFSSSLYSIESTNTFIENRSGQIAGGGALFVSFNNKKNSKAQLILNNKLKDYQLNGAGDNSLGTDIRVSNHDIKLYPPKVATHRSDHPVIFGAYPLLNICDFIQSNNGFDLNDPKRVYLW